MTWYYVLSLIAGALLPPALGFLISHAVIYNRPWWPYVVALVLVLVSKMQRRPWRLFRLCGRTVKLELRASYWYIHLKGPVTRIGPLSVITIRKGMSSKGKR